MLKNLVKQLLRVARHANDRRHNAALRAGLRERMLHSPSTGGERYDRFLETAYRNIWRDWCRAPVH